MEKKLNSEKILGFFIHISSFVFIFMMTISYCAVDMDYWARLLQGNAFWQLGHILKIDPFSYTETHIWLDHEWGSSVVFSFIQKIGYTAVLIFKSILVYLTFFFISKTINYKYKNRNRLFDIFLFVSAVFAMPTITQSWLRCHFFTFLFFTLSLFILEIVRKEQKYKLLFLLPVLMILWANMHGGCVSLLGILLVYAAGEFLNKKHFAVYLYTFIACLAAMFINPYGIDYVKFIFMASFMNRPFVTEWISPFAHKEISFLTGFKLFYIFAGFVLLWNLKKIKTDYTKYIILIICAYLSFKYIKNTPFFIITSVIFLYEEILSFFKRIFSRLHIKLNINHTALLVCVLILLTSFFFIRKNMIYLLYPNLSLQPQKVVNFIKINELKGNILAPFDMGSYIAYKLFPNNLIYMDGRYEEVYYKRTKDLQDVFYNVSKNWEEILNTENKPDFIIIPYDARVNDFVTKRKDYRKIYQDSDNCLYSKIDIKVQYKQNYPELYNHEIINPFSSGVKFIRNKSTSRKLHWR